MVWNASHLFDVHSAAPSPVLPPGIPATRRRSTTSLTRFGPRLHYNCFAVQPWWLPFVRITS